MSLSLTPTTQPQTGRPSLGHGAKTLAWPPLRPGCAWALLVWGQVHGAPLASEKNWHRALVGGGESIGRCMYWAGSGSWGQRSICKHRCLHRCTCGHRHQAPEHRISGLAPAIISPPQAPSYPFSFGKSMDSDPERSAPRGHSRLELKRFTDSHPRPPLWKQDSSRGCTDSQLLGGNGGGGGVGGGERGNVTRSAVSMTLRWTGWWSTVSSEL